MINVYTDEITEYLTKNCGFNENIVIEALTSKKYHRIYKSNSNMKKAFDNIDIDLCIDLYSRFKIPIYKIAMINGVDDVSLRKHMIAKGCIMRGHACGKNSQNTYFETIDTFDKAYFLGLIAADGTVVKNKKNTTISITLTEDDSYILDKFNVYGNFNIDHLNIVHPEDNKPRKLISIASNKIAKDLSLYGIIQNKSHKDSIFIPNIKADLIHHFIRGYFDGDGIAFSQGYIGFCGSKTIIEQINRYFVSLGANKVAITYNKSNRIYYTQWASKKDCKMIFDIIYKDKHDLYLQRKYNKIINGLQARGVVIH